MSHSRSFARRACAAVFGAAAIAGTGALPAHAAGVVQPVRRLGTVDLQTVADRAGRAPTRHALRNSVAYRKWRALEDARFEPASGAGARLAPPSVAGSPVSIDPVERGFEGEGIQDTVFTNGFEVEPPDQGLCGGTFQDTTFLFESVNLSIALYDTSTSKDTPSISLNSFFGLPPSVNPDTGRFGPFLSDPKCYFDPDTGRWFHTVLLLGVNPETGDFDGTAATLIAASTSRNPLGTYNLYAIDASDPGGDGCPCFGDQPLLGADANGLFVSTAEYNIDGTVFNGAQVYALDKRALSTGGPVDAVHFSTGTTHTGTLQPATAPNARYETAQDGTEYFLAAFDCEPPDCHVDADSLENTIQISAITHTKTLRTGSPDLRLLSRIIPSQRYGQPVPQQQKAGFHPYGESLRQPVPDVEANDARMNQVVYAAGRLWGGVNTIATPGPRDGIAWFQVSPSVTRDKVSGTIKQQGYLATRSSGGYVSFPSIGVNDAGHGVIAYSLMGADYHPSAAWTGIDRSGLNTGVQVAELGRRAEDGFTCYPADDTNCRWGDYSASFALPNGEVWSAAEYIGSKRTTFANWSTFVWPVRR